MRQEIFYVLKAVTNDGFINSLNDLKELYKLFEGVNFNLNTLFYYNSEFGVYNIEFDILEVANIGVPIGYGYEVLINAILLKYGCFKFEELNGLNTAVLIEILKL